MEPGRKIVGGWFGDKEAKRTQGIKFLAPLIGRSKEWKRLPKPGRRERIG